MPYYQTNKKDENFAKRIKFDFDVFPTRHYIDAYKEYEAKQAMLHLEKLKNNNPYIFDRGYFSREFLYRVYNIGSQFCFGVQLNANYLDIRSGNDDLKKSCRETG